MKTFFRWIRYIAINAAFAALIWIALFVEPCNQNPHIAALVVFVTLVFSIIPWIMLPVAIIAAFACDKKDKSKLPKKISVIPGWLDVAYDLAITGIFIYAGWYWIGGIYCLHIIPARLSVAAFQHAADKQHATK